MDNLFILIGSTFIVILIAIALLSIGWILTGKARIRAGSCGRFPEKKEGCGSDYTCEICHPEKKNEKLQ